MSTELPDDSATYRFAHALVRECLYEGIGPTDRIRLHATIGAALERLHESDVEAHLPEIADHHVRGALFGNAGKAHHLCIQAAEVAAARHAYEDAVRHYERAQSVLWLDAGAEDWRSCTVLVDLAAAHEHAGGIVDRPYIERLEEALDRCAGHGALHARLLARTAVAYYWSDERERCDPMGAQAVAVARKIHVLDLVGIEAPPPERQPARGDLRELAATKSPTTTASTGVSRNAPQIVNWPLGPMRRTSFFSTSRASAVRTC